MEDSNQSEICLRFPGIVFHCIILPFDEELESRNLPWISAMVEYCFDEVFKGIASGDVDRIDFFRIKPEFLKFCSMNKLLLLCC